MYDAPADIDPTSSPTIHQAGNPKKIPKLTKFMYVHCGIHYTVCLFSNAITCLTVGNYVLLLEQGIL